MNNIWSVLDSHTVEQTILGTGLQSHFWLWRLRNNAVKVPGRQNMGRGVQHLSQKDSGDSGPGSKRQWQLDFRIGMERTLFLKFLCRWSRVT